MIKIVSYALFAHPQGGAWKSDGTPGRLDGYMRYLPGIIRAHHALWPDWHMVLHHDKHVSAHRYYPALLRMRDYGLLMLRNCGSVDDVGAGPMWRFRPAFEEPDALVLCHDIDSFPSRTMRRCADEFAATTYTACVVHGCESHNTAMAGLFMFRGARFRELVGADTYDVFMSQRPQSFNWYGSDEHYLRDVIWPRLEHDSMLLRIGNSNPSLINSPNVRRELSQPLPADRVLAEHLVTGDSFAPYPGAAGFDTVRVVDYYDAHCTARHDLIVSCEQGIATGREIAAS